MDVVSNLAFPGDNNETGHVIVRVSKGGNSETREIPTDCFEKSMSNFTIQMRVFSPSGCYYLNSAGRHVS